MFPGGCVSFGVSHPPLLTPWFGNQDLLSQLFESVGGRPVRTEGFVGHVKVTESRVGLVDDLVLGSRKHQTSLTYAVASHLQHEGARAADFPFLDQMTSALREATLLAHDIRALVGGEAGWMSRVEFTDTLACIDRFYHHFLRSLPEIRANFSAADIDAGELIASYRARAHAFRSVLACATSNLHLVPQSS